MKAKTLDDYGFSFQQKLIAGLLQSKQFIKSVVDQLEADQFSHDVHQWIVVCIVEHFTIYGTAIPREALEAKIVDEGLTDLDRFKEEMQYLYSLENKDLEYFQNQFKEFLQVRAVKRLTMDYSSKLDNTENIQEFRDEIESVLKIGGDRDVGHEHEKDIEERYQEKVRNEIPTPWKLFNEKIQGGLGGGDFGLIFGNPGGGKSWSLVAIGGYAVQMGYNVVHYTLELDEYYVGKRYDAYFTNIPVNLISDHKEKVRETLQNLKGRLIIKEFTLGKTTLNTLKSHIQKIEDVEFKPDLIIIDYVDLLKSSRKSTDRKQEIDDIYTGTKGLARELNLPVWSVSQVNRSGAQEDIIEGDKAAGSYDKIMITDLAISLSRKKEDKVNGTGRFHFIKNRYGEDGMTFSVNADTSTGHFEVLKYQGLDEMSPEQSVSFVNQIKSIKPKEEDINDLPF